MNLQQNNNMESKNIRTGVAANLSNTFGTSRKTMAAGLMCASLCGLLVSNTFAGPAINYVKLLRGGPRVVSQRYVEPMPGSFTLRANSFTLPGLGKLWVMIFGY